MTYLGKARDLRKNKKQEKKHHPSTWTGRFQVQTNCYQEDIKYQEIYSLVSANVAENEIFM